MAQRSLKEYFLELFSTNKCARNIFFFAIIIATFQLVLTYIFPVGPTSNPIEVYHRNISTIISLVLMAIFFRTYYKRHSFKRQIYMKQLRIISLFLAVASISKAAISAIYSLQYVMVANFIFLYYFGEVLVWTAVACFAIAYYRKTIRVDAKISAAKSHHHHHHELD